jgi:hypothetical protein
VGFGVRMLFDNREAGGTRECRPAIVPWFSAVGDP